MTTSGRSNWAAGIRTMLLLATLGGVLVAIGFLIGGPEYGLIFLGIAALINFFSYWFSDKIALKMSRAQPLEREDDPELFQMVEELAQRADLPMPRLYLIPHEQPNAFATGRNPKNAAVAVTAGIRKQLPPDELRGVLAHELAHVRNRDILIQSVAATIGAAITFLARMLFWFGGGMRGRSPIALIGALASIILAPIAAMLIQMAVSRQREYSADATGAQLSGNPESLASALLRIQEGAQATPMEVNQAAEPLYIIKPIKSSGIASLFSTHPPVEERVRRLRQMRPAID